MIRKHIELYAVVLSMVFILLASSLPSVSFLVPIPDTENGVAGPEPNRGHPETRSPVYAPQIVCDENTTKPTNPMEIVAFNCTVRNLGNVTDDYEVLATPIKGWSIICDPYEIDDIPPRNGSAPDAEKNRSLVIRVVTGDYYNATLGKYTLDVTVKSITCPSNRSTLTLTIYILLVHCIDITPPEGQYRLPGEDVLYEFTVQNLGNGDDEYDIWVESSDDEWVVRLVDDTQGILKIQQGRIVVVPVIVYLPEEVDGGSCQITTLCVRPHSDPNASVRCGFVQTIVKGFPCKPFDMYIEVREKAGQLEDTLTFTVDVIIHKDYGKDKDMEGGITFLMSEQPSGWSVDIDDSNIPEWGGTKDLEYGIYVKVAVPKSTPVGKYNFTLDGYDNGPPMKFVDCVTFHVDVLPTYRAEIVFNESEKITGEEENVPFSALLTNTGNVDCNYNWTLSCHNDSWIDKTHGECTLEAGEIREIEFNIFVPSYTIPEKYEFKFHLYSKNEKNISIEHVFRLEVTERLDFEFVAFEGPHYVNPGEERFVDIEVMNTGNTNATISFDVFGEPWALLTRKNLFIPYRGTEKLSLQIVTGENNTPGEYSFTIMGRITTDTDTSKTVSLTTIIPTFEFICSDLYIKDLIPGLAFTGYEGEMVNFYIEVYNTGNQYFDLVDHGTNLTVMIRLGDELIQSDKIAHLDVGSWVRVYFNHTFTTVGMYSLRVEINNERLLHESDYNDNYAVREINIIPKSPEDNDGDDEKEQALGERGLTDLLTIVLIIFIFSIIIAGAVIFIKKKYPLKNKDELE